VPTPILVGYDPRTPDVAPVARVGDPVAVLVEMSQTWTSCPHAAGVTGGRSRGRGVRTRELTRAQRRAGRIRRIEDADLALDRGCGADGYSASEQSSNKDALGQATVEEISDVKANVTVQLSDHPSD
jgi:hypothetical protein